MIDVVIPARDEAKTLAAVLSRFARHQFISRIIVCVDGDTTDGTERVASVYTDHIIPASRGISGKGQLMSAGVRQVTTPYVMFCDADYDGLNERHVTAMAGNVHPQTMKIGVPEFPTADVPNRVISAWPWVSGIRVVPVELVQTLELHGYLAEVQMNMECQLLHYHFRFVFLNGLVSPYKMSPRRLSEMDRDRDWATTHGIFK